MSNFYELRTRLRGDDQEPWYIIRRGQKIRALCLRKDLNPKASFSSVEVWLGADALAIEWGQRLAAEKMALPVLVAEHEDADYKCLVHYDVQPRRHQPEELSAPERQTSRP